MLEDVYCKQKTVDGSLVYQYLDLGDVASGLYLLHFQSDNFDVVKKVLKQ